MKGLPVPDPVEAWCELGALLTIDELVIAGDALLRRKRPLSDFGKLRAAVVNAGGRPGVVALSQALVLVRARTDSPMETVLRLAMWRAGLPEPRINHCVDDGTDAGAHVDLAYPDARLAIEYDGEHHRTDERQYAVDGDRLWRIESAGWRVLRINRTHMAGNAFEAIRRIGLALASMGRETP